MAEPRPDNWERTDAFLTETFVGEDPALDAALVAQQQGNLPAIEVSAMTGKLLYLLARIGGACRILEIGTLGGYSAIWLARALPEGGMLVTIEAEESNARIARANIDAAGLGERVEIIVGRGADVLPTLTDREPFDFVFIDADKESNTVYLDWAARLARPGAVVVLDNIARSGDIVDADSPDPKVRGSRAGLEMLGADQRFDAAALQTVGAKGWDGIAVAIIQ